ncbi:unnamed protein product [Alopecurus aequalis]
MGMELELGLAPPNHARPAAGSCGIGSCKRASAEAFGVYELATLPLFVRDDDGGDWEMSSKRKKLVGWPPVKSTHRRRHVKVKMEGEAIGRKVDLSLHGSYHELLRTLRLMFPASSTNQDAREELQDRDDHRHGGGPYAVTYEDADGDWLLVGDVPWEDFAKSAKRLKILV